MLENRNKALISLRALGVRCHDTVNESFKGDLGSVVKYLRWNKEEL